jgi:hypothetical protein
MHAHLSAPPRSLRPLALALFAGLTLGLVLAACTPADPCVGGVVLADGSCVAKCDASKCAAGNTCVGNACALTCTSHLQCNTGTQQCLPAVEDGTNAAIFTCQTADAKGVGKSCANAGCDAPLTCLSAGPGDATAYCTGDCLADSDCPGGFECGYVRDPHKVCGTDAGVRAMCGTTTDDCVQPASINTTTSPLVSASYCLQRKTCLKRTACAPCSTDVDCSRANDTCVALDGGAKICAPTCQVDTDCSADKQCTNGACTPRYGACAGQGFCAPCRYDLDCGPDFACVSLHGDEKSCINLHFPDTCTAARDCPKAPSGRHGICLDETEGLSSTDSAYHHCYAPFDSNTNVFSCYVQPPTP